MNVFTKKFLLPLFIFLSISCLAQEFTPVVSQFTKKDYNASNQNWAVGQGTDGVMYFGNNQGLLEFDGSQWQTHQITGNKIVRSLLVTKVNRIFTCSFEEFGYFDKNTAGQLIYHSLSDKLKNYKMQNDGIWNILDYNGTIIFSIIYLLFHI